MFGKKVCFFTLFLFFIIYSAYVYSEGTVAKGSLPLTTEVQAGLKVFQNKNCIACHQLYGLGGYMGPDLTHVISDPYKGPEYAAGFIEFGTSNMPNFNLTPEEVDNLVQFLTFLDSSGTYNPEKSKLNWDGTVDYNAK